MATDVDFSCRCGALSGVLHGASPASGCHIVCYCNDCRTFATHLGVADALLPGGGTPLFQTLPSAIEITQGAENIACLRLSPKGLHRWYAACCGTPLANTAGSSRVPLAGLWRPLFAQDAPLGPVRTHAFTKYARPGPGVPKKDKGLGVMVAGLIKRAGAAYLSGTARDSPFFHADGAPVAVPTILDRTARAAARDG